MVVSVTYKGFALYRTIWTLFLALVFTRFFVAEPFLVEAGEGAEAYYNEKGDRVETSLNQLGNLVFYFFLELEGCFKPMDEIMFFHQVAEAYPDLSYALVFYDPKSDLFNDYSALKKYLKERFDYTGPYFFDREDSVLKTYNTVNEPRIFIFNNQGKLLNILSPADTLDQKARVRYYFEVAREHL